jgi:hypothetical protein
MTDTPGALALAAALALGAAPFGPAEALPHSTAIAGWCGQHPPGPSQPFRKRDGEGRCPGACHAPSTRTRDLAEDEEAI